MCEILFASEKLEFDVIRLLISIQTDSVAILRCRWPHSSLESNLCDLVSDGNDRLDFTSAVSLCWRVDWHGMN